MTTERTRTILEDLEQTLLQFKRKHKITHDEYCCATDTGLVSAHLPKTHAAMNNPR